MELRIIISTIKNFTIQNMNSKLVHLINKLTLNLPRIKKKKI